MGAFAMSESDFPFDEGDLVRINLNTDRKGILDAVCTGFVDLAGDRTRAKFEVPGINPNRIALTPRDAEFEVIADA